MGRVMLGAGHVGDFKERQGPGYDSGVKGCYPRPGV